MSKPVGRPRSSSVISEVIRGNVATGAAAAAASGDAAAPKDITNPETGEPASVNGEHKETTQEILDRIISFHPFTTDSYEHLLEQETFDKSKAHERASKAEEAHLVDGELIFGAEEEDTDKPPPRNPDLREGNVLRDEYGIFPTDYYGKPLEEIDKGIRDKTFVVIGKKFRNKNIFRFSATRALFLLPPWNVVRRFALYVATHQFFDLFIICTILVNCVFLTMPGLVFAETSE
ncbi:hypothetical protein V1264_001544 [Littorina saxatilis]|uniref:Uncharacterized protein n=2 Tax=Littorina saxatilis TaxID=31220 RepID=A0AAN9C271_9CAEN